MEPEIVDVQELPESQRLKQLEHNHSHRPSQGKAYSKFVKIMRLMLPLLAFIIIAVLFAWPTLEEKMEAIPKEAVLPKNIAKNELLNPNFSSLDEKNQPYNINAQRAVQSSNNPELVLLEHPFADITLTDGTYLKIKATQGAYKQHDEKLLLEGNVTLTHNKGYELITEKLLVDLKVKKAWSDTNVSGSGPTGNLSAKGLQLDTEKGILIFTGPVTMELNRSIKGF